MYAGRCPGVGRPSGAHWPGLSLTDLWDGHNEVWVAVTLTVCDKPSQPGAHLCQAAPPSEPEPDVGSHWRLRIRPHCAPGMALHPTGAIWPCYPAGSHGEEGGRAQPKTSCHTPGPEIFFPPIFTSPYLHLSVTLYKSKMKILFKKKNMWVLEISILAVLL